jgi:hypothetical protein
MTRHAAMIRKAFPGRGREADGDSMAAPVHRDAVERPVDLNMAIRLPRRRPPFAIFVGPIGERA